MAKMTKTALDTRWEPVKSCASGKIPKNKTPFKGAYIFLHPECGFIRIAYGNGMNGSCDADDLEDQVDENGNELDDNVYITVYPRQPLEGCWKEQKFYFDKKEHPEERSRDGLLFVEDDGFNLLYSTKTHKKGDLREFVKEAIECVGWPSWNPDKYWLWGVE